MPGHCHTAFPFAWKDPAKAPSVEDRGLLKGNHEGLHRVAKEETTKGMKGKRL